MGFIASTPAQPPVATAQAAPNQGQYKPMILQGTQVPASVPAKSKQTPAPVSAIDFVRPMIHDYEQFRPDAYLDEHSNKWTIGYGQTEIDGRPVREGDVITERDASAWTEKRLNRDFAILSKRKGFAAMKPHEQAAILDIAYTTGSDFDVIDEKTGEYKFKNTRAALDDPKLKESFRELIPQFRRSNGKIVEGLVNRRRDTLDMFKGLYVGGYKTRAERQKAINTQNQP